MPRTSDAKQKLTDAALGLIWTSGYVATSVDDICHKAKVKKGSFYHFFKSKAELEVAALECHWQRNKIVLNEIFSSTVPPLERLETYFDLILQRQGELLEEYGAVLGCPVCSVGMEISGQEASIREKSLVIMQHYLNYLESALRDAHAQKLLQAPDAKIKARVLFAYVQGLLAQARIANSLDPFRGMKEGAWDLLGLPAELTARA